MIRFLQLLLIGLFFFTKISAQKPDPDKIFLNQMYVGSLSSVLDSMAHQYGVKIIFDHPHFEKMEIMVRPFQESLSNVLKGIAKEKRLRLFLGTDGIIYLIDKVQVEIENTEETYDLPKKDPNLTPTRFNFSISGKIRDRSTGEAIPYAIIQVLGTKISSYTNVDGYFSIIKMPSDTSTLVINSVGYKKLDFYLNPELDPAKLLIDMRPDVTSIEEVVISTDKKEVVLAAKENLSMVKISPKKIAELPNIGEKDVMRSFQLMPGVSASNESSSGLYVRGGTPDQNLILFDGFTVYHVDHLYGFYSAFNSNAIKDISLYKGGFEAKYSGRLSSVTDITGKDGNQNKVSGGGDLSLLSANAYLEIPIGTKFTSVIAGRRSYQGLLYDKIFAKFNTSKSNVPPVPERRGAFAAAQENTVTSYFYDINGKFTYRPTDKDVVSLSIYKGADNLDNSRESGGGGPGGGGFRDFNSSVTDITDFGNFGSSLKWSRQWNNKLYINNLVGYSEYYSTRDRTNGTSIKETDSTRNVRFGTLEDNTLKEYSFKSSAQYQWTDFQKLEFGVQLSQIMSKYSYSQNDTSSILNRNDHGVLSSFYIQDKIEFLNKKFSITPGLRATYYDQTKKLYTEPRLSLGYDFSDKLKWSASFGRYYQFVSRVLREDISSGSRDFWVMADEEKVPVGEAFHYITGVSYDLPKYTYSIEAYYKNLKGLTEYSMRMVPAQRQLSYEENFYNGRGYAMGLELMVQKKTGPLTGWMSYTLARARNQFDVYGANYFASLQDIRHEYKSVAIYKYKRYTFSGTWIYASGRPYTAPLGSYTLTLVDGTSQSFVGVGAKNASRFPSYQRLDLAASINFRYFDKRYEGMLSFSLFNVLNRSNIWYKEFQIIDGVNVENQITYLGITPNVTLNLKF